MFVTKRQKQILDYLKNYISRNGYSPTFDEIAAFFSFSSKGTVYKHIRALKVKGLITQEWNRARSIEIESDYRNANNLPVLGRVAAGKPIEAIEATEELSVPAEFIRSGNHYILRVVGNSMIEEHITDGDFVVVQEKANVDNGETVVALIDGSEVTIKKLFKRNNKIELRPANEKLKSLILDAKRVSVQGIVVGVLRKY